MSWPVPCFSWAISELAVVGGPANPRDLLWAFCQSLAKHGLMAFGIVQKTGEMGVRMALGARRTSIVWLVLREALLLAIALR